MEEIYVINGVNCRISHEHGRGYYVCGAHNGFLCYDGVFRLLRTWSSVPLFDTVQLAAGFAKSFIDPDYQAKLEQELAAWPDNP